jgi:hypothetical protein
LLSQLGAAFYVDGVSQDDTIRIYKGLIGPIKKERKPAMTLHIDCTTRKKIESFCNAIQKQMSERKPVDLGKAAADAGVAGLRIVAQTEHYHIEDHGTDWRGRFTCRAKIHVRPEYRKTKVWCHGLARTYGNPLDLIDALKAAEARHLENIRIPTEEIIDRWSRGSLTMEQAFDMMVDWGHDPEVACDMLRSRDATLYRKHINGKLAGVIAA